MYFFSIPALEPKEAQADFNDFCRDHRIIAVDRHFVSDAANSYWAIAVVVAQAATSTSVAEPRQNKAARGGNIDYREVLSPEDFVVFAGLRDLRKQLAQRDGIPVFGVLTNQQLAEIAQKRSKNLTELADVAGIGQARITKYGSEIVGLIASFSGNRPNDDGSGSLR